MSFFYSRRVLLLVIAALLAVGGFAASYFARRSPLDRGTRALIAAFRDRRLIEPRLSGGFAAGLFNGSVANRSNIREDNLDEAKSLITDAVASGIPEADHAYARLLLSEAGDSDLALRHLRLAIGKLPASAELHNDLGVCLIQGGQREDAIDEFEKALVYEPQMPEAIFNRAICYEKLQLRDTARADFDAAAKVEPDRGWAKEIKERRD